MKFYGENLREGQKNQYIFKTKTHNLEILASIHKKNATLLETSLQENCGKFLICHPKIGGILYPKSSSDFVDMRSMITFKSMS